MSVKGYKTKISDLKKVLLLSPSSTWVDMGISVAKHKKNSVHIYFALTCIPPSGKIDEASPLLEFCLIPAAQACVFILTAWS